MVVVVIVEDWFLGFGVEDDDVLDFFGELVYVVGKFVDFCVLGCDVFVVDFFRILLIGVVEVVVFLVVLELVILEIIEVEVSLVIVIDEVGWVNVEVVFDGFWVGGEWFFGFVVNSDINVEDVVFIVGREVEVVFVVFGCVVWSLKLFGNLRDVFGFEDDIVVGYFVWWWEVVDIEDMIVGYIILVVIVVELNVGFVIVGGVDVDFVIEDVSWGVGGISGCNEGCYGDDLWVLGRCNVNVLGICLERFFFSNIDVGVFLGVVVIYVSCGRIKKGIECFFVNVLFRFFCCNGWRV